MMKSHFNPNSDSRDRAVWNVHCDHCDKTVRDIAQHMVEAGNPFPLGPLSNFRDPGDAADRARNIGFVTKARGLGEPMDWLCPHCQGPLA